LCVHGRSEVALKVALTEHVLPQSLLQPLQAANSMVGHHLHERQLLHGAFNIHVLGGGHCLHQQWQGTHYLPIESVQRYLGGVLWQGCCWWL